MSGYNLSCEFPGNWIANLTHLEGLDLSYNPNIKVGVLTIHPAELLCCLGPPFLTSRKLSRACICMSV
jgi:hypothetical protein